MTFGKRGDDCWHWEYTGPYAQSSKKKLWRFWLATMFLVYAILGLVVMMNESLRKDNTAVLFAALDMGVCVTVPFVILWYMNRHSKRGCSYTANERIYTPLPSLHGGGRRHTGFHYSNIDTLTQCPERDAIIININGDIPGTIYADAEDYDAVWNFFREHKPEAEVTEPVTGGRYDALFELERDEEHR